MTRRVPLIFGGHQSPLDENSPNCASVKTIFNRSNEVSDSSLIGRHIALGIELRA